MLLEGRLIVFLSEKTGLIVKRGLPLKRARLLICEWQTKSLRRMLTIAGPEADRMFLKENFANTRCFNKTAET